jgi:hypothetical protein
VPKNNFKAVWINTLILYTSLNVNKNNSRSSCLLQFKQNVTFAVLMLKYIPSQGVRIKCPASLKG